MLTGWQSPTVEDYKSDGPKTLARYEDALENGADLPTSAQRLRNQVAALTGWATPRTEDSESTGAHRGAADTLHSQSQLAGWPTPMVGSPAKYDETGKKVYNEAGNNDSSRKTMEILTGWPTPNAMEGGATSRSGDRKDELLIGGLVRGITTPSSTAETRNPAASALNAAMSRWLQGYPLSWDQSSPGFAEWRRMQDAIASGGCEDTGTR
jgi:hypothetical protein